MPIQLRPAQVKDSSLLAELNHSVQELHLAQRPADFHAGDPTEVATWFRTLLGKPTTRAWIAEADGCPIGYVLVLFREQVASPFCPERRWCEIDQLVVAPTHRRQGIGRLLIQQVQKAARAEDLRQIELCTWAFNTEAQQVFERLGFHPRLLRLECSLPSEGG